MDYIHDIPGRLRVRSKAWKDQRSAKAMQAMLSFLPGVRAVETRTLTGSIKISYDPGSIGAAGLLAALREAGFQAPASYKVKRTASAPYRAQSATAAKIAGALTLFLVEKALERSFLALVARAI